MKILLLGEYSGLHHNLALGLRALGHQVTIASDGDGWKDYARDINLRWKESSRKLDIVFKLSRHLFKLRGFDIVQLINPIFVDLRAENNLTLYKYLLKHNKNVFLGANGDDSVYMGYALAGHFKTSIFNSKFLRNQASIVAHTKTKLLPEYQSLNTYIADTCKGITACCTEYQLAYAENYSEKLQFIPLPIQCDDFPFINTVEREGKLSFFLGIQEHRKLIKGMNVILLALDELKAKYPNEVEVKVAQNIPFDAYKMMLNNSHVLCDQLYSYGCGMNGAMAMAKGLVVAGGGEVEMYQLFGEAENRPIINLPDTQDEIVKNLEEILHNRSRLPQLAHESRAFALKYHDHIKVAQKYLDFWKSRV